MKTTFHRISIATLAVSALLFSAVPAHAGSITMADLAGGGSITAGNLIFSDFSFSYGPTNTLALMDFGTCPVSVVSNKISFTRDFDLPPGVAGAYFAVEWDYKVTTISSDYSITGLNGNMDFRATMGSTGVGHIFGNADVSYSNAVGDVSGVGFFGYGPYFKDVVFAQSEIFIHTYAYIGSTPDFDAGDTFAYTAPYQEFTVAAIPEPATALLFGLGGMGAWMLRRNKKKIEDDDDIA